MKNTKKITTLSVCIATAMILSFIESRIPALVAIPGIKVGLANIAVIFVLFKLGAKEAIGVSLIRVALSSLLFGSLVSFIYSFFGALCSLSLMILLKRTNLFGIVGVSVTGGLTHNIAQIATASVIMDTNVVIYYLPFLLVSGTVAGVAVGIAGALLVKRIDIKI